MTTEKKKYSIDKMSKYIIKNVFSYLNEIQKLYMIIYNRQLQKICEVDSDYYKKKV